MSDPGSVPGRKAEGTGSGLRCERGREDPVESSYGQRGISLSRAMPTPALVWGH